MKHSLTLLLVLVLSSATWANSSFLENTAPHHSNANSLLSITEPSFRVDGKVYENMEELVLCEGNWTNLRIEINLPQANVTYNWIVPPSVAAETTVSPDNSFVTVSDISGLAPLDDFAVRATAPGCDPMFSVLDIKLVRKIDIPTKTREIHCTDDGIEVIPFFNNRIESWAWDLGGGEMASGDSLSGDKFFIKYPTEGDFTYTMIVTDSDGCQSSQSFDVTIYDSPPLPQVECPYIDGTQVLFDWSELPEYEYEVNFLTPLPGGAVESMPDATSILVEGVNTSNILILEVKAIGDSPEPCDESTFPITCRACIPTIIDFDAIERTVYCIGDVGNREIDLVATVTTQGVGSGEENPPQGSWDANGVPGVTISTDGTAAKFDPNAITTAGEYQINYNFQHPLDFCEWPLGTKGPTIRFFEKPQPNMDFEDVDGNLLDTSEPICADTCIFVTFTDYENIPPPDIFVNNNNAITPERVGKDRAKIVFPNVKGTYEIIVQYEIIGNPNNPNDRCDPIQERRTITVNPVPEVFLECNEAQSDGENLSIVWNDVDPTASYNVYVNGEFERTVNTNSILIPGLEPKTTYNVSVEAIAFGCPGELSTIQCETIGCREPAVVWNNQEIPICGSDTPFVLDVEIVSDDPLVSSSYTWADPSLVNANNELIPIPGQEIYNLELISTECAFPLQLQVIYIEKPEPLVELLSNDTICVTSFAELQSNYTSPTPGNITYEWDFSQVSFPATVDGVGPHEASFDTPGNYLVSLVVDNLGCKSDPEQIEIVVQPEIDPLQVVCNPARESIRLDWDLLPDVTEYEIYVNGTLRGTTDLNTFNIDQLTMGTEYDFEVIAISDTYCTGVSFEDKCTTNNCFPAILDNKVPQFICSDDLATPFLLDVDVMSSEASITSSWEWDPADPLSPGADNMFTATPGVEDYNLKILYTDANLCTEEFTIPFSVLQTPTHEFELIGADTLCITDATFEVRSNYTSAQSGVQYNWDFGVGVSSNAADGPGPHTISFDTPGEYYLGLAIDNNGCFNEKDSILVVVEDLLPEPNIISCNGSRNSLTISWDPIDCASEYAVFIDNNLVETVTDPFVTIDGLTEATEYNYTIEAISECKCSNTSFSGMCETTDCDAANFNRDNVPPFVCYVPGNGPILLDIVLESSNPAVSSSFEWEDTDLVTADNMFTPRPDQEEYALGVLFTDENGCPERFVVNITVLAPPVSQLELLGEDTLCIDNPVTSILSNYSTSQGLGVIYSWDLGSASSDQPADNLGPYDISFDSAGEYYIGLTVNNNDCVGEKDSVLVVVQDVLPEPSVECSGSRNAINVSWDPIDCASSYEVYLDGALIETVNGTQIQIPGLAEATDYEYRIVALSDCACGNTETVGQCSTTDCDAGDFNRDNVPPVLCYDPASGPILLDISLESSNPAINSSFEWEDPSLVSPDNMFTPTPGVEVYSLGILYTDENDCIERFALDLIVIERPVVDLELTGPAVLCIDNAMTSLQVNYSTGQTSGVIYDWDLDAASSHTNGGGPGPFDVSFDSPGEYYLGLTIDNNACVSSKDSVLVSVEAALEPPVVECEGTRNELNLTWGAVDCAAEYEIFLGTESQGTTSNLSFTIENLDEDSDYEYTVLAISDCACDDVMTAVLDCSTTDCFSANLTYNDPGPICWDPADGPIQLDLTLESSEPGVDSNYEWDTPLVDTDDFFMPDNGEGEYTLDLIYTDEFACTQSFKIQVVIVEQPVAQIELIDGDQVCVTDGVSIVQSNYSSTIPGVVYSWDLDGGTTADDTDTAGPLEVTFDAVGEYTIRLLVDNNGCVGVEETVTIMVEPELMAPVIDCTPSITSILLEWQSVDCASEYEIRVDGALVATVEETEYRVEDLDQLTDYNFEVMAISECECGNVAATLECGTAACPPVELSANDLSYCYQEDVAPFEPEVEVETSGTLADGEGSWSGRLIDADGNLDISLADAPGNYLIEYTFNEEGCIHTTSIEVSLSEPPTVDLDITQPQCLEEGGTVIVTAEGGTPDYEYAIEGASFQSENIFSGIDIGTFEIEVQDASGCIANTFGEILDITNNGSAVSGPEVVVEMTNPSYILTTDIDPEEITDIIWSYNGEILCSGPECVNYTFDEISEAGTLAVEVFYSDDCALRAELDIEVTLAPEVYTPNVVDFSEVGNAGNDKWIVFIKGEDVIVEFVNIYDRWGNLVESFENENMEYFREIVVWDGFNQEKEAMQGVYTFVLKVDLQGKREIRYGSITVLR